MKEIGLKGQGPYGKDHQDYKGEEFLKKCLPPGAVWKEIDQSGFHQATNLSGKQLSIVTKQQQ